MFLCVLPGLLTGVKGASNCRGVVLGPAARSYLDAVRAQLAELGDDGARARALTAELDAASELTAELGAARRAVLARMRQTMTVQQIADAVGISRSRIYALMQD